ncbi:RNA polymerase dimerization [Methanocaldococcus infernus ME]|uniref:DNA-directed RNA polymerase subunit Rpo11 n=1 Tax=Methanocaldococcus infernus (strain DSM 11812 / JCM 15783 / ME) TaxID=573063 RepID=D5VRV9_METIM|nr:DNA-directed RNA polymerase subunit L [Methanocaldococcus infernus]ADG13312.1 RNA polymerase dimerization [Methanocaldococcus infernus ME]
MEVKILERKDNLLEVELVGEDHSLPNLLKDILLTKKGVKMASYHIEHPLLNPETGRYISNPKFVIITEEGTDPVEVLKESLRDVIKMCDTLLEDIQKYKG